MHATDGLKRLEDTPRVPFPPGMAVPERVWTQAAAWPTRERVIIRQGHKHTYLCCEQDGQSIAALRMGDTAYYYEPRILEGLILAHLIQAHGWSREGSPDE